MDDIIGSHSILRDLSQTLGTLDTSIGITGGALSIPNPNPSPNPNPVPALSQTLQTFPAQSGIKRKQRDDEGAPTEGNTTSERPLETHKRRRSRRNGTEVSRRMACPFGLFEPLKYPRCLVDYNTTTVSQVRSHLRRVHSQPVHCPKCGMEPIPRSQQKLEDHLRDDNCETVGFKPKRGISKVQFEMMDKAVGGKQSQDPTPKWKEICGIIFPGSEPPETPFIGPGHVELLRVYYQAWRRERGDFDIILETIGTPNALEGDTHKLAEMLSENLEQGYKKWLTANLPEGISAENVSQQMAGFTNDTRPSFSRRSTAMPCVPEMPLPNWQRDSIAGGHSYASDAGTTSFNPSFPGPADNNEVYDYNGLAPFDDDGDLAGS